MRDARKQARKHDEDAYLITRRVHPVWEGLLWGQAHSLDSVITTLYKEPQATRQPRRQAFWQVTRVSACLELSPSLAAGQGEPCCSGLDDLESGVWSLELEV